MQHGCARDAAPQASLSPAEKKKECLGLALGNNRKGRRPVRMAGGWFVPREKVLLAGCYWLVCSERKVLLTGG
jgi:hypothetical protein